MIIENDTRRKMYRVMLYCPALNTMLPPWPQWAMAASTYEVGKNMVAPNVQMDLPGLCRLYRDSTLR